MDSKVDDKAGTETIHYADDTFASNSGQPSDQNANRRSHNEED